MEGDGGDDVEDKGGASSIEKKNTVAMDKKDDTDITEQFVEIHNHKTTKDTVNPTNNTTVDMDKKATNPIVDNDSVVGLGNLMLHILFYEAILQHESPLAAASVRIMRRRMSSRCIRTILKICMVRGSSAMAAFLWWSSLLSGSIARASSFTSSRHRHLYRMQSKAFGLSNIGFAGFRISVPSATRNTFANLFP